jgi:60 kDa SS-A/Ro ribonucleoprotein
MTDVLTQINTRSTPQTMQADPRQVPNHGGGWGFQTTDEERLRRFLVLGSAGGTFYQGERELTKENGDLVLKFAAIDPLRLVEVIVEFSVEGRTPKQNTLIFSLAAAASSAMVEGRQAAFAAMPVVLRTGTHFMLFERYVKQFRGRGMGLRKAEKAWLDAKTPGSLGFQMAKYRQREGFTWRDILRMVKRGKTTDAERDALYGWAARGQVSEALPKIVHGFLKAQEATKVVEWVGLVKEYGLPWEMLPDKARKEASVWRALIDKPGALPWEAMQRNLPTLTRLGLLSPLTDDSRLDEVVERLTDVEAIHKARIHPFNVLVALRTYAHGRSLKGSGTWQPVQRVVDALDQAFYLAFRFVEGTGKNTLLSLDVSGSMTWSTIMDSPLTPREASAAMALVTAATENHYQIAGFSGLMSAIDISPKMRLDDVLIKMGQVRAGPTDCSLPFVYALVNGLEVETFVTYTDAETNGGDSYKFGGQGGGRGNPIHVHQALRDYRHKTGIPARHVVVGMTATQITVLDPDDPGSLGLVGFDSNSPAMIADFSCGAF